MPAFLTCEIPASVRSTPLPLITLGDSLTGTYEGAPYGGTHHSWTDLLRTFRLDHVSLHNLARAGATSADLLGQGQHSAAVELLRSGRARHVTLAVGANDIGAFLAQLDLSRPMSLNPARGVEALVGNVEAAVAAVTAAGGRLVLANVPNIADTPSVRPFVRAVPPAGWLLATVIDRANARIAALADRLGVPMIDLRALHALSSGPLHLGGVDVQHLLHSTDGFHPSAIGSGLLANAKLEALWSAYGIDVPRFSDAELLRLAGLKPLSPAASFDISRFVIRPRRRSDEAA